MVNLFLIAILLLAAPTTQESSKPRLFVTDSQSWEMAGGFGGNSTAIAGAERGGARPQTAEIIKTFGEGCPAVTITSNKNRADYVLLMDHEGGKGLARKDTKFAVFDKDGDAIKSGSTRTVGNGVKDACDAVVADWKRRPSL